jgi:hypothetical protein
MQINQGTEAAEELFKELRKNGLLVDAYSEKWLSEQDNPWENGTQLECVQKKNKELGTDSINHLLILYIKKNNNLNIQGKLASIYPKLSSLIDSSMHQPVFLFFNLAIQKVLCVGLGRNNRLFVFDADHRGNDFGGPSHVMSDDNKKLFDEFTKLDHCSFVAEFLDYLDKLGESNYFFANDWDGDEETTDYLDAEDDATQAMKFFKTFFPMATAEQLNSEMSS